MLFNIVYVLFYPIAVSSFNSGSLLPNIKLIKRDAFTTSVEFLTSTISKTEVNDLLPSSKDVSKANTVELKTRNVTVTLNDFTSPNSFNATTESRNEMINATTKSTYKADSFIVKPTVTPLIATVEPSSQNEFEATTSKNENISSVTLTTNKGSQTIFPSGPHLIVTVEPSSHKEFDTATFKNENTSSVPLITNEGLHAYVGLEPSLIVTVKLSSQNGFETATSKNEIVNISRVLLTTNEGTQTNVLNEPPLLVTIEPRSQKEFETVFSENIVNFSRIPSTTNKGLQTNIYATTTSSFESKTTSLTLTKGTAKIFNNTMIGLNDTKIIKIRSENYSNPTTEFKNNQTMRFSYNKTGSNMSSEDSENMIEDYNDSYDDRFVFTDIPIITAGEKINDTRQTYNFTEYYDINNQTGFDDEKPINLKDQLLFLSITNSTPVKGIDQNENKKSQGSDDDVKEGQVVLDFDINYSFIVSIGSKINDDPTFRKIPSGLCTGSLITPLHVITVSRCFIDSYWDDYEDLRQNYVDKYFVRSGSPKSISGGNISKIYDIFIHPSYGDTDYGLAILELEKPIYLSRPALSTSLQELYWTNNLEEKQINYKKLNLKPGEECQLIGWTGIPSSQETGFIKESFVDLRKFNVVIAQWDNCVYEDIPLDGNEMICANTASERKLPCPVNMGSPLLYGGKHVGLAVWSFGCESTDYPLLFARVDSQVQWIREIVTTAKQFYINQFKASFTPKITLNIVLFLISSFINVIQFVK